jgi:hypothetical protein
MKKYLLFIISWINYISHAQNIQILFENIPYPSVSCEETFKTAEIEWDKMTLDNDSVFNRAKSWAPGGDLKIFSGKLEKLQAYIDRTSENNGFSLSAPPTIDKDVLKAMEHLTKTREGISNIWITLREQFVNLNSTFIVPNELDNGCDQIQSSIQQLNEASAKYSEQLNVFKSKISNSLTDFQTQFDELNKNKHPMVSNQILDEMSNLLSILNEISNALNFHYKNMVETRMAWNNAFCK